MRSEQVGWIDMKEKQPENHQSVIIHFGWMGRALKMSKSLGMKKVNTCFIQIRQE